MTIKLNPQLSEVISTKSQSFHDGRRNVVLKQEVYKAGSRGGAFSHWSGDRSLDPLPLQTAGQSILEQDGGPWIAPEGVRECMLMVSAPDDGSLCHESINVCLHM